MTNPWNGPRHRSWASDTVIFAVVFVIVLITTVLTDWLNGADPVPPYLTGLLGASAAALFGAAGSDKSKRDKEVSDTADRAEAKADQAVTKSAAVFNLAASRVLDVQRRELAANQAALKSMRDAVEIKAQSGESALPETFAAMAQLEVQIELLAQDIDRRQKQLEAEQHPDPPPEVAGDAS